MALLIPQVRIFKILEYLLGYVKTDLETKIIAKLESEAWLYRCFYDIEDFGSFNWYNQIKDLILADDEDARKLELRLGFDRDRATLPTIHIHTPSEAKGRINGLGVGFDEVDYYTNYNDAGEGDPPSITYSFSRSFLATYELITSAGNREETTAIYELLKAIMIAGNNLFLGDFPSFEWSGRDIMLKPELIPTGIFVKSLMIQLDYLVSVPEFLPNTTIDELKFEGKPIEED